MIHLLLHGERTSRCPICSTPSDMSHQASSFSSCTQELSSLAYHNTILDSTLNERPMSHIFTNFIHTTSPIPCFFPSQDSDNDQGLAGAKPSCGRAGGGGGVCPILISFTSSQPHILTSSLLSFLPHPHALNLAQSQSQNRKDQLTTMPPPSRLPPSNPSRLPQP